VRPWLYRIARNRCLNHLRRARAVGMDSMDIHFAEHGATTADRAHEREEFRQLLDDIRQLPETQRTALVLREMEALSYEQIAVAMETTIPSVKSLLVRARVSLTEAAEARLLSCDQVREELVEEAEGLRDRRSAAVRRHVKSCERCRVFQRELRRTDRALSALAPIGLLALARKLLFAHALTHSAGSAGVAGAASVGGGSAGIVTAGASAAATKAAAGLAAAAILTAGTVAVSQGVHARPSGPSSKVLVARSLDAGLRGAIAAGAPVGMAGAIPGFAVLAPANSLRPRSPARQAGGDAGALAKRPAVRPAGGSSATRGHRHVGHQRDAARG
jgi:DNA-binding Lrp family transcriptional regulator